MRNPFRRKPEVVYGKEPKDPTDRLAERIKFLSGDIIQLTKVNEIAVLQSTKLLEKMEDLIKGMKDLGGLLK